MKANAPEKIYLHLTTGDCILNGKYYEYKPAKIRYDDKIIEYTRTDAFINKVCERLKNFNDFHNIMRYSDCCEVPLDQIICDFKNYITEE